MPTPPPPNRLPGTPGMESSMLSAVKDNARRRKRKTIDGAEVTLPKIGTRPPKPRPLLHTCQTLSDFLASLPNWSPAQTEVLRRLLLTNNGQMDEALLLVDALRVSKLPPLRFPPLKPASSLSSPPPPSPLVLEPATSPTGPV